MKQLVIIVILLFSFHLYSQQPIIETVVDEVCDTLNNYHGSLESINRDEATIIVAGVLRKHINDWEKEKQDYITSTGNSENNFNRYFEHLLQLNCEKFRVIEPKTDTYLDNKKEQKPIYLKTKELVILLENNKSNDQIMMFFNKSLKNKISNELLNSIKKQISKIKRNSIRSIIVSYRNGYNFSVLYRNYLSNEPEFLVTIYFKNLNDTQIDEFLTKSKKRLMEDKAKRLENNKKIENGTVSPPPPPPRIK